MVDEVFLHNERMIVKTDPEMLVLVLEMQQTDIMAEMPLFLDEMRMQIEIDEIYYSALEVRETYPEMVAILKCLLVVLLLETDEVSQ